ncbi:MAG: energy transducer TonB [Candidatus Omnitrophota bacterium]
MSDAETEFVYSPEKKAPVYSRLVAERQKARHTGISGHRAVKKHLSTASSPDPVKQQPLKEDTVHAARPIGTLPERSDLDRSLPIPVDNKVSARYNGVVSSMLIADDKKDLSSEPVYLDYYNAVRSCIYKTAQANKPDYFVQGEVCLIFILSRSGRLLNAGIIAERSTKNPILQRHALSSIERASPFPAFHESMKEQQLTLRINISFEK